jgi:DNA polymerase elongation subunit (family B)
MPVPLLYLLDAVEYNKDSIALIGITPDNKRGCVLVPHPRACVYLAVPKGFREQDALLAELEKACSKFNRCTRTHCKCPLAKPNPMAVTFNREPCAVRLRACDSESSKVLGYDMVQRNNFLLYEPEPRHFMKIYLKRFFYVAAARRFLQEFDTGVPMRSAGVYECVDDPVDALFRETGLSGFTWIEPGGVSEDLPCQISTCQHEANWKGGLKLSTATLPVPKLRCMTLDIETLAPNARFTANDPIGMIAYKIDHGPTEILTHAGDGEDAMLIEFRALVHHVNPDAFMTYNGARFDLPRLLDRMQAHGICIGLSRLLDVDMEKFDVVTDSNQSGGRKSTLISCPGRISVDAYMILLKNPLVKLRMYTLKYAAKHFELKAQKDDVAYQAMYDMFYGPPDQRKAFEAYCKQDVEVTWELACTCKMIDTLIAQSQVKKLRANDHLERGQSFCYSRFLRDFIGDQFVVPEYSGRYRDDYYPPCYYDNAEVRRIYRDRDYKGAVVLPPKVGVHKKFHVCVFDFNSLYPNIIIANNLCPTTFLPSEQYARQCGLGPDDWIVTPNGFLFCKPNVRKGILPRLLRILLDARAAVRAGMKDKPEEEQAAMDALQTAYKILANSIYGICGAPTNIAGCPALASATTAFGREYILAVAAYITEKGYGNILYGDTDSVMVELPGATTLAQAREQGAQLLKIVNVDSGLIRPPLKMGLEGFYFPFYMQSRKHYAACHHEAKGDKPGVLKTKGIETVRRDSPVLVGAMLTELLTRLLIAREDEHTLADFAQECVRKIFLNKLPLEDFVLTRSLGRPLEAYKDQEEVICKLARQLQEEKGVTLELGMRVEYVLAGTSGQKKRDKARALELFNPQVEALDLKEYVERLEGPFRRVLDIIFPDKAQVTAIFNPQRYTRMVPNNFRDQVDGRQQNPYGVIAPRGVRRLRMTLLGQQARRIDDFFLRVVEREELDEPVHELPPAP